MLGMLGLSDAEADPMPAGQQQLADRSVDIARAIDSLRLEMRTERTFVEIQPVRELQKSHLRVNGKLPDYIEVGLDVWFAIYDWHIRWQQPLSVGRDVVGRYTLVLLQTLVVLRTDVLPTHIGIPYDSR
jgi:hypothetical protein